MRVLLWVSLATVVALAGCSGGDDDAGDGGSPATDGGADPTGPDIPWLSSGEPAIAAPMLGPCPSGWRMVDGTDGPPTCEPYPEAGRAECTTPGEAHFPGEPDCRRVGPTCPADGIPADLPTDQPVIYVLASAAPGGDGTRAQPYDSPAAFALGRLAAGTVLALGDGRYDAGLRVPRGLVLWGACTADTELTTSAPHDTEGVVTAVGADVVVRNLSIVDAERRGVVVNGTARTATLESVIIANVWATGALGINGGSVFATDLVVRDTRRQPDGRFGRGFDIEFDGEGRIERGVLERNHELGAYTTRNATLIFTDVAIVGTMPQSDGTFGTGIGVQEGSGAELTRVLVEDNHFVAINVLEPGSNVSLSSVIVRGTRPQPSDDQAGRGLVLQQGASGTVTQTVLEDNYDQAVFVHDSSSLVMSDTVLRGTLPRESDGAFGRGLSAQLGSDLEATRTLITSNHGVGVFVEIGAVAALTDLVVRDTAARPSDGKGGTGINVQFGGRATVVRALLERNRSGAVFASEPLETDSTQQSVVSLEDVVARDTMGRESDGLFGRGLIAQLGAQVDGLRLLFERNRSVGVFSGGAVVMLQDVVVQDTLPRDCASTSCTDEPFGMAASVITNGTLAMRRFLLEDAPLCGAQVAHMASELDLDDGRVQGFGIGACVQVMDYDLARLTTGVVYTENGTNLQATDLPVPEAVEPGVAP